MNTPRLIISIATCFLFLTVLKAQDDKKMMATTSMFSAKPDSLPKKDSPVVTGSSQTIKLDSVPKHDPRKATRRSAVLPGWGQAYNKQYWKIPLVYGVMAIPVGFYIYNNNYYQKTKYAYDAHYKAIHNKDSSMLAGIDPELKNLQINDLQNYRNSFRRDRDYCILWFVVTWALQVVDATVSAHLLNFDVSTDLSMQIKPQISNYVQGAGGGLSVAFNLKNPPRRVANIR
jgi:hypothetical protein